MAKELDLVAQKFGDKFKSDVIEYAKDGIGIYAFSIVSEHNGFVQEEDWGSFKEVWVDQGCHYEDEYYGSVYIPLPDGTYLKCDY